MRRFLLELAVEIAVFEVVRKLSERAASGISSWALGEGRTR